MDPVTIIIFVVSAAIHAYQAKSHSDLSKSHSSLKTAHDHHARLLKHIATDAPAVLMSAIDLDSSH